MKTCLVGIVCGLTLGGSAKPSLGVADGYADWSGLSPKNRIVGRQLTASDLRHRVTVVVHVQTDPKDESAIQLGDELRKMIRLPSLQTMPEFSFQWDTEETIPRKCLVLVSVSGKCTAKTISRAVAPRPSDNEQDPVSGWLTVNFYSNVEMVGCVGNERKYPYVYVMGPRGTEPLWKGVYDKGSFKEVSAAVRKGIGEIGEWTPLIGVATPQFFTKEARDLLGGKPANPVLARLQKCFGDADVEKAKEAQIMYDAIWQYRSDIIFRIKSECSSAPARAFVDAQSLFKLFPQDKKNLQDIDAKLKANKSIKKLGKMFDVYLMWNRPDFSFKNMSEAKKAVKEVSAWRKSLELIANDQSAPAVAGEASLILSQLDGLPDVLMSKVAQ